MEAAAGVGLNLQADFADAAILFKQPHREQPRPRARESAGSLTQLALQKHFLLLFLTGAGIFLKNTIQSISGLPVLRWYYYLATRI